MHQRQDHHQDDRAGAQHQHRLDDLHPGGRQHAAERDVDDHGDADEDHRPVIGDPGQQSNQHAGAGHLRHQIGEVDDDSAGDRRQQRGSRLHPAADDVAEGIFAGVAHRLGNQEKHGAERDQRTERVERAVHAVQRRQPGKSEERRCAAPVAGQRKAVLRCGELAVGGVEVAGGGGAFRRPIGDAKRDQQDDAEDAKRDAHVRFPALICAAAVAASGSKRLPATRP